MIEKRLLDTLRSAYDLGEYREIEQIHNGSNRVFRLSCRSGPTRSRYALKLYRPDSRRSLTQKQAEKAVLDLLRPDFPHVPHIVRPKRATPDAQCHPWGLVLRDNGFATLYEWVPTEPFRATTEQLHSAGQRFGELQRRLARIDHTALPPGFAEAYPPELTFSRFAGHLKRRADLDAACAFALDNLPFLEDEAAASGRSLHAADDPLASRSPSLLHLELSPSNFGFDEHQGVKVIFDFDSLGYGPPALDTAWMTATFCLDHRDRPQQVLERMLPLLSGLGPVCIRDLGGHDALIRFMRLGYLLSIHRKLLWWSSGRDPRPGFVKEDILSLRWLRTNGGELVRRLESP